MSQRDRRTISLSPESNQILDRLGNHSSYIDKVVQQHARDWTEALALLRSKQWLNEEVVAACDALTGYALATWSRGGEFLARELERQQERTRVFTLHEVVTARRARLFRQLREDPGVPWALATVCREYHLPNDDLRHALGKHEP